MQLVYYDKMLEEYPELLAQNVNAWFQREPAVRMVRTIDGTARAFLSNRYRRIDNLDIAGIVLPVLQEMEGMHFESCQLTDSRMYIKVVNTRLEAEVVPGDIVQSGIIISNSEVGLGSVSIQPLVYRLVCSNGMDEIAALAHTLREEIEKSLHYFYLDHMCLLVTRECIDDPNKVPEIYNKATSCVWRDGAWLLMEDTETAILLSAPIINELPPAEAAA